MSNCQQTLRLPSADGHGEYDRYVLLPIGYDTQLAVKQINDIIHLVNREDDENDGVCLDGNPVEENIERRVTELGFIFLRNIESTNDWDVYDPQYVLEESSRNTEQSRG